MMKTACHFKSLFVILVIGLFVSSCSPSLNKEKKILQVHVMNVGYGDAILIKLPDESFMMIDAGEKEYSKNILDYLSAQGVNALKRAVITHPHTNHFEGFQSILKKIPIHHVFINGDDESEEGYDQLIEDFKQKNVPIEVLRTGSRLKDLPKGVKMKVLHPRDLSDSVNGSSLVLWLSFYDTSFLFTGDIEKKQQNEILKEYPFLSGTDFVKVPHHGGPLSDQFAKGFDRAIFVISTGRNKWGLPSRSDLDKIKNKLFRTDRDGSVIVQSDGKNIEIIKP